MSTRRLAFAAWFVKMIDFITKTWELVLVALECECFRVLSLWWLGQMFVYTYVCNTLSILFSVLFFSHFPH